MRFIEEVVVDEFLPTFRSMLAEALRERGLTQNEVAELLGISQSAVSKYVHGEITRNERVLTDDRTVDLVERLADGLAAEEMSRVQALVEAEVFIRQLERGDLLAALHEEAMPALAEFEGEFAVHDPDSGLRAAEQVRSSVRRGLTIVENTGDFADLVPAVGSNLVECLPEAGAIEDVVAVPGRILDIKGRATIPADPEFGVSEFVASVLLAARAAGSDARAALNLRYDEAVLDRLEAAGLEAVEFEVSGEAERTRSEWDDEAGSALEGAIAEALAESPGADVLYQTGGFGIEPIIYVLGPDAPTVASAVRDAL